MGLTHSSSDLLPGTLELLILKALVDGAKHGYGIVEHLRLASDDVLRVGESALYPALQRLLLRDWVKADWGASENNRRARYYTLTAAGRKQLAAERAEFNRMVGVIQRVLGTTRRAGADEDVRPTADAPAALVASRGDLREEIETHRALRQAALERAGLGPDAAAQASRRALGNVTLAVEDTRDVWAIRAIDHTRQDLRDAARGLRRSPGFALVAIATLALGIGANTALFSIFNSLILRPLPVRDPGNLALLTNGSWPYPIWDEIRTREQEIFDGALAWSGDRFDLSQAGHTVAVDGAYVSGGFFDVLGVPALRGRLITRADDHGALPDGPVAVISDRFWRTHFGGAADIIGRPLTVQRVPFTVVGVMPPEFFGADVGRMVDVVVPFSAEPLVRGQESRLTQPGSWWLQIMVRLKPGQSLDQANGILRGMQPHMRSVAAATSRIEPFTLAPAATGNSSLRSRFEAPLSAMIVAVGLVLLVACANIASLLLARAVARRRELSVRLALGASRWRLARLLFTESLLVASIGAALGLAFATWGGALLVRQLSTWQADIALDLALDWRVLAFTAALACLSAIVAGVAPVLGLRSVAPGDALKDAGRGISGDRRFAVRGALVIAQIALSLMLVIAAGLFLRTFASLHRLPLGFVPEPLLVVELNLQAGGAPREARAAQVQRLQEVVAAVPGVRASAVSAVQLLTGGGWATGLVGVGDSDAPLVRSRPLLWLNATSPGWFATMGIPLRSGRDFERSDRVGGRHVAIVNEAFVRRYLQGAAPIGRQVRLGFDRDTRHEIVGVVGDAVYTTPRDGMVATMYVPVAQRSPAEFWPAVLLTIDAAPGGLALLLAAIGLYGVVTHAVRARQTEIGVRIALGAAPSSIVRLVFQRVGLLIAAGLACGLAGGLWAARFVEALLFRLDARDPVTFAGAASVLILVGLLAAWLPARRAARLDPVTALREG